MSNYTTPENWDSLPVKEATLGGVRRKIKVDSENNIIYLMDEHGNWTGEKAKCTNDTIMGRQKPAEEQGAEEAEVPRPFAAPKRKRKNALTPILVAIIVVLAALLLIQNAGGDITTRRYTVIIAMEDIHPGESIEGKLSSASITAEEYARYANEGGLYSDEMYKEIKSYVATEFIAKDAYITYSNVGNSYQASNPWMMNIGHTITLPVEGLVTSKNLGDFLWGTNLCLEIRTECVIDEKDYPDAHRPTSPEVSGESSIKYVQIDDYILNNFTIVDVLDANKKSLYDRYAAMIAIPEAYQEKCLDGRYSTLEEAKADLPAYITIEVSEATERWWAEASYNSEITVNAYFDGNIGCKTDLQRVTYFKLKALVPKIISAWNQVSEGGY